MDINHSGGKVLCPRSIGKNKKCAVLFLQPDAFCRCCLQLPNGDATGKDDLADGLGRVEAQRGTGPLLRLRVEDRRESRPLGQQVLLLNLEGVEAGWAGTEPDDGNARRSTESGGVAHSVCAGAWWIAKRSRGNAQR